jgi:hypothetical protein
MRFNTRLFFILWIAGVVGVASFLLVDLNAMLKSVPFPAGTEVPDFTFTLKLLSLIQPSVLLAIAVFVGVRLAPKVGLSSPFAEAIANNGDKKTALISQILPGIAGGFIGGAALILAGFAARQFLATEITERMSQFGQFLPLPTRLLYGGVVEELLLRWGVMTFLVWALLRVFQKGKAEPNASVFVFAILFSSLLFAIGHLPIAYLLVPERTLALTMFVIIGNSLFGLVAGFLYWKKGLESAMIAHAITHLVLFSASYFGGYF